MPSGIHRARAVLVTAWEVRLLPSSDHDLVGKLGHVHIEMMIRSHVRMEPSKILGVEVQSWEGFLGAVGKEQRHGRGVRLSRTGGIQTWVKERERHAL